MVRDYPSDTGSLPLEIWQIIAGKINLRDWGRAAASACRMFHTLRPGTHCHNFKGQDLDELFAYEYEYFAKTVCGTDVIRCAPESIKLLKKAAERMRGATAILLDLEPYGHKLPSLDLTVACVFVDRLRELQIRDQVWDRSHKVDIWVRASR